MTAAQDTGGPSIDAVIVNWNTGELLRDALSSLAGSGRQGLGRVGAVVVDNASSDDSLSGAEDAGLPVRVIRNAENRGFAAACNQGAAESSADYLLFLNPDVTLMEDTLSRVVEFMESDRGAGIGIAGVRLEDGNGDFIHSCAHFPTLGVRFAEMSGLGFVAPEHVRWGPMHESECREDREVDHVAGAFFFMRGDVFRSVGGFDERFFVYNEECDLALRANQAGWPSYYLAGVRARHLGNRSTDQVKPQRLFYLLRSRAQYFDKHFPRPVAAAHAALSCVLEPVTRLLHSLIPSTSSGPADIIGAFRRYYGFLARRGRAKTIAEHGRC